MRGAVLGSVTAGVANHIGYGKSAFAKWAQKDIYNKKRIQAPVTARVSIFQRIVHYITVSVVTLCVNFIYTISCRCLNSVENPFKNY
jgi:hypothetical protein